MTVAMPMPRPPSTRQSMRSGTLNASPEPTEEMTNRAEPSSITFLRPQRSARLPANQAPIAQPIRAIATTKPVVNEPREKWSSIESTAPLMTELSKPNRKPPTAAATLTPMTFAV
ncbi:unannotated protein [freshwater metagenome]|uniref:Unannotated protein n=1 Tax=freshwater metagenome TaxID=449393 RepID=A0A6J7ILI7_9ZZZZ